MTKLQGLRPRLERTLMVMLMLASATELIPAQKLGGGAQGGQEQAGRERQAELVVQLGHTSPVTSVALSADGKYLVTGADDGTAKLWEVASGKEVRTFREHSPDVFVKVFSVALSADGKYLATATENGAKLWEVPSGKELRTFLG